jgi:Acyl-coenzyme A oxidase N-terminal
MSNVPKTQIQFPNLPILSPGGSEILARERAKATFDAEELAKYIHGEEYLEQQERILNILQNEPLFDKSSVYFQGRNEKFRSSMAKAKRMIQAFLSQTAILIFSLPRNTIGTRKISPRLFTCSMRTVLYLCIQCYLLTLSSTCIRACILHPSGRKLPTLRRKSFLNLQSITPSSLESRI